MSIEVKKNKKKFRKLKYVLLLFAWSKMKLGKKVFLDTCLKCFITRNRCTVDQSVSSDKNWQTQDRRWRRRCRTLLTVEWLHSNWIIIIIGVQTQTGLGCRQSSMFVSSLHIQNSTNRLWWSLFEVCWRSVDCIETSRSVFKSVHVQNRHPPSHSLHQRIT